MRYSLIVYKDNNTYEIKDYSKYIGFKEIKENTLEGIINFTNIFTSKEDLTDFLIEFSLIPKEYINGTFHIGYRNKKSNTIKLLQYGISFNEDIKFFEPDFLINYFIQNITTLEFMELFFKKYYDYLKNVSAFAEELNFINYAYNIYLNENQIFLEYQKAMRKFVSKYLKTKDSKGNYKYSISKIRDLAMFTINYERTFVRSKNNELNDDNKTLEYLKNQLSHYENLVNDEGITIEEYEAYIYEIEKLKAEITLLNNTNIAKIRRIN